MSVRVDRFGWQRRDVEVSPCAACRHWKGNAVCDAFPDKVPDEILKGDNNHRSPYPGDHGIQFEPIGKTKR